MTILMDVNYFRYFEVVYVVANLFIFSIHSSQQLKNQTELLYLTYC